MSTISNLRRTRPLPGCRTGGSGRARRRRGRDRSMILIAGPYRSGTGDDPGLMARNLRRLEHAAWPLFRAGHLPVIGEWVALPVLRAAGGTLDSPLAEMIMYPTARRLIERCDAILRLPGDSRGADLDVAQARERGIPVYHDLAEVPGEA